MKSARAHHTSCAGISLVELLAVIGLAGTLCAIAAPQLPAFRAQFQLGSAARLIAVNLHRARMKAVGENAFSRLVFSGDATYVLQSSPNGMTFTNDEAPVKLPPGISFVGSLPQPTFNRLGALTADASVTVANSSGQTKVIQINMLGQVTIS